MLSIVLAVIIGGAILLYFFLIKFKPPASIVSPHNNGKLEKLSSENTSSKTNTKNDEEPTSEIVDSFQCREERSRSRAGSLLSDDFFRISFQKLSNHVELSDKELLSLAKMPIPQTLSNCHLNSKSEETFLKNFYTKELLTAFNELSSECVSRTGDLEKLQSQLQYLDSSPSRTPVVGRGDNSVSSVDSVVPLPDILRWHEIRYVIDSGRLTAQQIVNETLIICNKAKSKENILENETIGQAEISSSVSDISLTFPQFCELMVQLESISEMGELNAMHSPVRSAPYLNGSQDMADIGDNRISFISSNESCVTGSTLVDDEDEDEDDSTMNYSSDESAFDSGGIDSGVETSFPPEILQAFHDISQLKADADTDADIGVDADGASALGHTYIDLSSLLKWAPLVEAMANDFITKDRIAVELTSFLWSQSNDISTDKYIAPLGESSHEELIKLAYATHIDMDSFFLLAIRLQRVIDENIGNTSFPPIDTEILSERFPCQNTDVTSANDIASDYDPPTVDHDGVIGRCDDGPSSGVYVVASEVMTQRNRDRSVSVVGYSSGVNMAVTTRSRGWSLISG